MGGRSPKERREGLEPSEASAAESAVAEGGAAEASAAKTGASKAGAAKGASAKSRKGLIVGGVLAVVLLCTVGGLLVWHEQPSFCNAICHSPMDAYVEGYLGKSTTDQSDQSDQDGMAAGAQIHQRANVACLDCHEAKISEQIHEASVWVSGDYSVDENGLLTTVGVRSDVKMCATSDCHDMEQVSQATQDWGGQIGVNVHDSHQGQDIDCGNCHSIHGQSYLMCNTCHDYLVPDGWAAPVASGEDWDEIGEVRS